MNERRKERTRPWINPFVPQHSSRLEYLAALYNTKPAIVDLCCVTPKLVLITRSIPVEYFKDVKDEHTAVMPGEVWVLAIMLSLHKHYFRRVFCRK